jgi:hypothetical protein
MLNTPLKDRDEKEKRAKNARRGRAPDGEGDGPRRYDCLSENFLSALALVAAVCFWVD